MLGISKRRPMLLSPGWIRFLSGTSRMGRDGILTEAEVAELLQSEVLTVACSG